MEVDIRSAKLYTLQRLTEALVRSGRAEEAAVLVEQQKAMNSGDLPLSAELGIADGLIAAGKWEEAVNLMERSAAARPQDAETQRALAMTFARLGRWNKAIAPMQRVMELRPDELLLWYPLPTFRLLQGDVAGYRQACREMLDRFTNPENWVQADRILRTCSLTSDAVADPSRLAALTSHLVPRTPGTGDPRVTRGLVEYRTGDYPTAVATLSEKSGMPWELTRLATLAMAHHRLGHANEARAALEEARAAERKIGFDPAKGEAYPYGWTVYFLHARIIFREAEQLLTKPSTQKS
jgi:predicted Zn-dependent protease